MSAVVEYKTKDRGPEIPFAAGKADLPNQSILEFASPSAAVIAAPPIRGTRRTGWIVLSAILAVVAATALIPIDIVVTAAGKVVSKDPTLVVAPYNQAIVRSIEVKPGQLVHKGDLLARLDPTFAVADLKSYESQVASYQAQIDRDKAEAEGKPYTSVPGNQASQLQAALYAQNMADRNFKLEGYRQQINSLELQIARDLAQAQYYRQRMQVAEDLQGMALTQQRLLVGSKQNSLLAIDNRLEMTRYMAQLAATAESEKRDLQNLIAQREAYDKEWYGQVLADMQNAQPQLDQATDNLKKAQLNAQLVELRAEQDAVVASIAPVSAGAVMQPGQQFFTLSPANGKYEVEANVVGSDAGYVHTGDPVLIKFDTYTYTLYGYGVGKVTVANADAFYQFGSATNSSTGTTAPLAATQPGSGNPTTTAPTDAVPGATLYYQDRVSLDQIKLHGVPRGFKIIPGMPTSADIKVGTRTMFGYIASVLLPIAQEGMREP